MIIGCRSLGENEDWSQSGLSFFDVCLALSYFFDKLLFFFSCAFSWNKNALTSLYTFSEEWNILNESSCVKSNIAAQGPKVAKDIIYACVIGNIGGRSERLLLLLIVWAQPWCVVDIASLNLNYHAYSDCECTGEVLEEKVHHLLSKNGDGFTFFNSDQEYCVQYAYARHQSYETHQAQGHYCQRKRVEK
jgi:hypothetical protein